MKRGVTKPDAVLGDRRRRRSLSTRAALFTLMGSGAFFGVLLVLSAQLLDDARARLLEERSRLARTTARLLEAQLRSDMSRVADAANLFLVPHGHDASHRSHEVVLRHAVDHGAFREGAFVFDAEGRPVTSAPGPLSELEDIPGLKVLLARARVHQRLVMSALVHVGSKPVLVAASPVPHDEQYVRGFVVGLFQPAASDLLENLRDEAAAGRAEIMLVDGAGVVVASTDRHSILSRGALEEVSCAITEGKEVQGACEQCADGAEDCEAGVMAFAPLPSLDLGLGVVQARDVALGPARALQARLWSLGGAVIVLFVLFNMLSVRSVVAPVTHLTRAVRRVAQDGGPLPAHAFGADEVGELADALGHARARALESLAAADASKEALRKERDHIRAHLETLQAILEASARAPGLEAFVGAALENILAACDALGGALELSQDDRKSVAQLELTKDEASGALERLRARPMPAAGAHEPCAPLGEVPRPAGPLAIAGRALPSPGGGHAIALVVAPDPNGPHPDPLWVESLLQHTAVCAAHLLLREANRARHEQQERFLQRVLQAQEDERSRVARELHDTVAQDLAALRLELERVSNHAVEPRVLEELAALERSATQMLDTVRRILLDLRLSILDDMGFVPAVRWMLERAEAESEVRTHLVIDGEEQQMPYERALCLFRIAQEALLNVEQHAGAEHVFVTVRFAEGGVELIVEDDGRGFDPKERLRPTARRDGHGLGVLGMEERAKLIGGTIDVSSSPGEGTSVRVHVAPEGALQARREVS